MVDPFVYLTHSEVQQVLGLNLKKNYPVQELGWFLERTYAIEEAPELITIALNILSKFYLPPKL